MVEFFLISRPVNGEQVEWILAERITCIDIEGISAGSPGIAEGHNMVDLDRR